MSSSRRYVTCRLGEIRKLSVSLILVFLIMSFAAATSDAATLPATEQPECDAAAPPGEFEVLYHGPGKFKGRGEFLRIMLEDKGVPYRNTDEGMYGPHGLMDAFRGSTDAIDAAGTDGPAAVLFPPALRHRPADGSPEVLVNQVGACVIYLGDVLDYAPATAAERARATCVLLNALDYLSEGRASFHPVDNRASYHTQEEEGNRVSKLFSQTRMLTYLHHFNRVVAQSASQSKQAAFAPVAGGPNLTYADFVLFHVLDATAHQFNSDWYEKAWDRANVPALKQYYHHIKSRPNLQAYFRSDRCARTSMLRQIEFSVSIV
jgi:glutathione S-transferase